MSYLLDTNTCIRYLNGTAAGVLRRIQSLPPQQIVVCSVVKAELFFGAMRSTDPGRTLAKQQRFLDQFVSLPFDDAAAEEYARVRADLTKQGALIGPNDLLIAAIALAHQTTLVTHNTSEFSRVSGLMIEDWEAMLE
jgi:tRNA(fMet)-specific endonuclease VapC